MKKRIFTLNEPNAPRINPALAKEIGLNESLILLQIEFWISISNNERDGKRWTYQSVRDMQEKSFPFWSIATINRAVNKLIDEGYIIEGNFNKKKYDKTRWFALNFETLNELESISINGDDTGVFQNDTRSNQNDTRSNQNDTTIPEITTEITTENTKANKPSSAKLTEDFEKLWKLYPNKQGKKKALSAYKKAIKDGTTNKEIQDGIVRYKKYLAANDWLKPAHGSTWFYNERWNDELDALTVEKKEVDTSWQKQMQELME